MEANSPSDDHVRLMVEAWHPIKESGNYVETKERCIKSETAQVKQLVVNDMNDNSQPDDHGRLVEELLQPDEQLVNDMKIDTGIHQL